jgi:hypothetical protein
VPASEFKVQWIDHCREPKCEPNPAFPNGRDIPAPAIGAARTCKVELPYPAKRCAVYLVQCKTCGFRAGVTTAGRPDDPRSVELPCYAQKMRE